MSTTTTQTRKFGAFTGVFTPTLLTILGVIMYVRLPWVVGNAGLLGAWLLMGLAMGITACTGLSLSSIATNTRIGAGGPYAIIQKSLGYEIGGSVGVPLYLTRPLGTAMYIFGFREGWLWVFPNHWPLAVDLSVFVLIFILAYIGADIAFRVQFGIMAIIVVSLVSIVASPALTNSEIEVTWFGSYPGFPEDGFGGISLWVVFAVFFPATTGILAGANMSGDLKNPRKAIPAGTLWAIGVSTVIYFGLAYCAARMGTVDELTGNYNLFMDRAYWGPAVLAGLLGATFSSALAGCVGGPRILMAMGEHGILPKSGWLSSVA
ncbi:MAG: Na-K-Cl cotransporter, partial [Rhodothermales bacterium]|nr:Na-K-Cl cotransporter [Rhodothermales bacterium]